MEYVSDCLGHVCDAGRWFEWLTVEVGISLEVEISVAGAMPLRHGLEDLKYDKAPENDGEHDHCPYGPC
jgi:hypothetical protein